MMKWGREELGIKNYALQTFSNNTRALNLYNRLGFKEVRREPLVMVENGDRKEWVHPEGAYKKNEIDRFNIHMELIL